MESFFYSLDIRLLYFINHTLSHSVLDEIMPIMRHKLTWIPLYLFFIIHSFKKYNWMGLAVVGFGILAVVLADQISSGLIKPYFQRPRPCNADDLGAWLSLPNGIGHGWSFISSHATNHFALALYFAKTISGRTCKKQIVYALILWASLIAFAQVYIGFHYPSDVIIGGLIGALIGISMERLLLKLTRFSYPEKG